ncbi:iron-containing redox enzyme family protein [Streptomyces mobaraensis]|uniref:Iron-containing redox enzyme family protein n=1 Tax=Streptomyces mobaraensis TaxID=35621 RepID=A0A5N5VZC8_STRMB|nr:iron-containing redox enzyme family protein [Streptomyces mobaraensis]KAB7834300.1 iron-containing redox enzyme family protein [Streptomyces mobaraensis]
MHCPAARGELSGALLELFGRDPGDGRDPLPGAPAVAAADPYGEDVQLALHLCYELHYRGLPGVSDAWEWDPRALRLRAVLESAFLAALRADAPIGEGVDAALTELVTEPPDGEADGASSFLRDHGTWEQLREYAVHRSVYQLKEADPHAWAIPRLTGTAKAGLVAVEYDEFGAGRADRVHAALYAELMRDLDLDYSYGHYVDAVPAATLATGNLMSLFGLHRALRGCLVGHFATLECTSPPGSRRMVRAMERLGAGPAAVRFYAEHVSADAVHEQLVRRDVVGGLLREEPALAADVEFGITATQWLEGRFERRVTEAWRAGRSSLRRPLESAAEAGEPEAAGPVGAGAGPGRRGEAGAS